MDQRVLSDAGRELSASAGRECHRLHDPEWTSSHIRAEANFPSAVSRHHYNMAVRRVSNFTANSRSGGMNLARPYGRKGGSSARSVEKAFPVCRNSPGWAGYGLVPWVVLRAGQARTIEELAGAVVVEPVLARFEATDNRVA
jgi:hypothetical protein